MQIDLTKVEGILWDMDGVLIDVSNSYRETIRQTASYFLQRSIATEEVNAIKKVEGLNNDWDATLALIKKFEPNSKISLVGVKRKFQQIYLGKDGSTGLIKNEKLLINSSNLEQLKYKYCRMGIVTGRPREEALYALEENDIGKYFDNLVAMEDTERTKPYPDPILLAMQNLNLKSTIYIGDSINDVFASDACGIPCLYIGKEKIGTMQFEDTDKLLTFLL